MSSISRRSMLMFARRIARGGHHRLAGRRIETEVVPDVGDGEGPLVGATFRKDPDRRVAGSIEGQNPNGVLARLHLRSGVNDRLQTGGARLLDMEARQLGGPCSSPPTAPSRTSSATGWSNR